ncbi:AraC family transcriptional regulator [Tahibacter sp.]|uniref:AraC family transcriptional regulator n=1 Tax=Tahibacter sp. TaxID=2056211 RepID=UPI0028C4F4AC|nr:AraC family transcriptional regulator [Tahibacter sp.]
MLTSEQGGSLRAALTQGGQFGRIAKALRRIHSQYERDLACEANMSVPAFHHHFKAVTHTSPIQYFQVDPSASGAPADVRSGHTAASASVRVGYESASQFSREFKRLFGNSPAE